MSEDEYEYNAGALKNNMVAVKRQENSEMSYSDDVNINSTTKLKHSKKNKKHKKDKKHKNDKKKKRKHDNNGQHDKPQTSNYDEDEEDEDYSAGLIKEEDNSEFVDEEAEADQDSENYNEENSEFQEDGDSEDYDSEDNKQMLQKKRKRGEANYKNNKSNKNNNISSNSRQEKDDKKHRKKRKKDDIGQFLDIEADIDDEEDDDADYGEVDKYQLNKYKRQAEANKDRTFNKKNDFNLGELEKRYQGMEDDDMDHLSDQEKEIIDQQSLQPTISDPKLWLIKVKPGKEKDAVNSLYHKFFYNGKANALKILSAFTMDALKGYIYIEAFKDANVREAVAGISALRENSIKIVPLTQMTQIFSFDKLEKVDLKVGQWIRIKIRSIRRRLSTNYRYRRYC